MNTSPVTSTPASFQQVLTSAEHNINLQDWSLDSHAPDLALPKSISVRKWTLHGGRQEGVELIQLQNGRIAVTITPTRGMGIVKVESPGLNLSWESPVREIVHPHFVNLQSRGGLGWLEGFNEWLVRCGLEFAGAPGKDSFVTNTGAQAAMDLTLHGKIANIPASEVQVIIELAPPYRVRLRGRVDEKALYGPKLELWTELTLQPDSASFRLQDTVINRGGADQEFEMIYHVNFGPPLLQEGSQFVGAMHRVTPMNAHAAQAAGQYPLFRGPTAGFVEQVYCMQPIPDREGRTTVLLRNAAGDKAASLTYSVGQLPCFTLWKNTNLLEEGYVTGLEPGTNYPNNRSLERKAGRLSKLKAGESRQFVLDIGLHSTPGEVEELVRKVSAIQGTQTTAVDDTPMA